VFAPRSEIFRANLVFGLENRSCLVLVRTEETLNGKRAEIVFHTVLIHDSAVAATS